MLAVLKLLRPGMYVKRWFLVLLAGMVVVSLGIGFALTEAYRSAVAPAWVGVVTLQFLPLLVRAALFLALGGALCALGLVKLYRSLADVLPPSSNQSLLERIYEYRFREGSPLGGHSFGNLFVLAMTGVTGSFEHAVRETSRVLAVQGIILPSTLQDVQVCARFADGSEACGESSIPEVGKPIERLYLKPEHPAAQPEAVKAILEADLIVVGPGSLYTSVVPNLLVEGIAKALIQTDALKVYVCNVATQPGETDGYDVAAHVAAVVRHMPGQHNPLDVVIAPRQPAGAIAPLPDIRLVTVEPSSSSRPYV